METIHPSVPASANALRQSQRARVDLAELATAPAKQFEGVVAPLADLATILEQVHQRLTAINDSESNAVRGNDHD